MFQPADGGHYREYYGFNFIWEWVSIRIQKVEDGSLGKYTQGIEFVDEFNTVLFAIGRDVCVHSQDLAGECGREAAAQ